MKSEYQRWAEERERVAQGQPDWETYLLVAALGAIVAIVLSATLIVWAQ